MGFRWSIGDPPEDGLSANATGAFTGTDTQDGFPDTERILPQHASAGAYTVKDAVTDYLAEIQAEKYVFGAWIPSSIQVEKLTTDRLNRWHNKLATQPN